MDYYLDRAGLLSLGLDPSTVDRLLRDTPLSGHDQRLIVAAEELEDLLGLLAIEEGRKS